MSSQGSPGSGRGKPLLLCRCDIQYGDQVYVARGLSIGRAPDNAFVIDDPGVARHHCQVEVDGTGGLVLRCVDAGAELEHQGRPVRELPIGEGLRFRVGPAEFECRAAGPSPPSQPDWLGECPFCHTASLPPPGPQVQPCPACGREVIVFQPRGAGVACIAGASGPIKLFRLAGEGGMGVVFKGQVHQTGQRVAVKLLHPHLAADKDAARRFQREIEVLRALKHPQLVTIVGFGKWNGHPALITEWLPGGSLAQVIEAQRQAGTPLPFPLAAAWLWDACQGLAAIHSAGLVHRDIKPSNLLLDPQDRLKIADLGLAKAVGIETSALTATGLAIGSPRYMAPEQWTRPGEVDARADIYALGVTFYELLTGRVPMGVWQPASAVNPTVPPWFDALLQKMLASEPQDRFETVAAVCLSFPGQAGQIPPRLPATAPPTPRRGAMRGWTGKLRGFWTALVATLRRPIRFDKLPQVMRSTIGRIIRRRWTRVVGWVLLGAATVWLAIIIFGPPPAAPKDPATGVREDRPRLPKPVVLSYQVRPAPGILDDWVYAEGRVQNKGAAGKVVVTAWVVEKGTVTDRGSDVLILNPGEIADFNICLRGIRDLRNPYKVFVEASAPGG